MEKDAVALVAVMVIIVLVCDTCVVLNSRHVAAECALQHKHIVSDWVGVHCEWP